MDQAQVRLEIVRALIEACPQGCADPAVIRAAAKELWEFVRTGEGCSSGPAPSKGKP